MAEHLLRDVMPADVTLPDGTRVRRCRVFLTSERVEVWAEGRPATLRYTAPIAGEIPAEPRRRSAPQAITTPAGALLLSRGRGCSCALPSLAGLRWHAPD